MLFSILQGGDPTSILISLLLSLPVIFLALSIHETAHGWVAWKCGDNTAYNLGRLTLNPIKHLDPMGALMMLLVGFGWAKPVPVNTRNFRNPKRDMALTAAAGPAANLLLGLFSAIVAGALHAVYIWLFIPSEAVLQILPSGVAMLDTEHTFVQLLLYWGSILFELSALYNFLYMAFNLIPVPPFDGSRIAFVFLPPYLYFKIMRYEREIMIAILLGMVVLSYVFNFSPFSWIADKLTGLFLSLCRNGAFRLLLNIG